MTPCISLDRAWSFRRLDPAAAGSAWTVVDLPHIPFVADLDGRSHWFGECEYQRTVQRPIDAPAGKSVLHLGAAMHTAIILVDGQECGRHVGGYLPFEIDLSDALHDGRPHQLLLRLDNRDNPEIPPGKPYADLDFCWYGGLYRGAELRFYPTLHITDPVGAGVIAGGGVFVRTLAASAPAATVSVRTHFRNLSSAEERVELEVELLDGTRPVARMRRTGLIVGAQAAASCEIELTIAQPKLWQPDSPALYHARVTLNAVDGELHDTRTERFGVRRISFSRSHGFTINGRRRRLRGTNRHQDYPGVGYAVPRAAQARDARRIKEAGFDYVRLSHYPQATEFLAACDELGIVVMNCIPGWQFIGDESFREGCYQNARELIRRDRNHPCVVLWELSLNETAMDETFMARLHAIGHEEYPGDQMFTCGWQDGYDVFVHARQHGEIHHWQNGDKALVISEYGDWEFYASNRGFNQKTGAGIFDGNSHGRQFRRDGERGLRQQAFNHTLALSDTLASPAALDGLWVMFDYARGYDPIRAAAGVMDIFRLPKFSYYFYRSQRSPQESGPGWQVGPMVFIASHWTPASDLRVPVYSNCEEVELRCNGSLVARRRPTQAALTQNLPHPPFVFDLPRFTAGKLEAIGYVGGVSRASHEISTPGALAQIELVVDDLGIAAGPNETDVLFAHAKLADALGSLCVESTSSVAFTVEGAAHLIGPSLVNAEAGIASVVLQLPPGSNGFQLRAQLPGVSAVQPAVLNWGGVLVPVS